MIRLIRLDRTAMVILLSIIVLALAACTPTATPTATPTKAAAPPATAAAPAATATTAPAAAATKPADKPAATPTTAASKPTGAPVKMGFVTPLSGPVASYGVLVSIAVKLAEADINNSGGINGSPLQLLTEDSPFDPKQTVTAVRKLADQGAFVIVGPYSSGEMEVAAPLANELKIVVASGSSTKAGIMEANRPWPFQTNFGDDANTPTTIDAYKKLYPNVKTVVLTGDTKTAVTQAMIADVFPKLLPQKGLTIIDTVPFDAATTDFSAVVTKIKDRKPDGIVLASLMPNAIGLGKELVRQQVTAPVVTSGHTLGGPIAETAPDAVEGWVIPTYIDWDSPQAQPFVKRLFDTADADPNIKPKLRHLGVEGQYYDTVMMIAEIMRKAGLKADSNLQDARKKVLDGMTALKDYPGIGGKISMLPSGDGTRNPIPPALVIQGGNYKFMR